MALRACEGKCGQSYEDHGEEPPAETDGTVAKFLCLRCLLEFKKWALEHGLEDPFRIESGVPNGQA
jgi:hypothetical protein